MINVSLNWASLAGILLFFISVPSLITSYFSVFFILQRRVDTSPRVIFLAILTFWVAFCRSFIYPSIGGILFFQGWRLDPILQISFLLLVLSLILFTFINIWTDYTDWRFRQGRAIAVYKESEGYKTLEDTKIKRKIDPKK